MYIIDQDHVTEIDQRYVVLELDTVVDPSTQQCKTYYCVLETIPLNEMQSARIAADSHKHLIQAYHRKDWQFCLSAAKGLKGRWNGELDTFYQHIEDRIQLILDAS